MKTKPIHRKSFSPRPKLNRKLHWKPGTMLMPLPSVLVATADELGKPNVMTIAWAGVICSSPPMLSVSIRPSRYSYELLSKSGAFTVNIPTSRLARVTDKCGVVSGRDVDKFATMGLTAVPSKTIKPPVIDECPVSMECKVKQSIELGSHVLFIADITNVQVSSECVTKGNRLAIEKLHLLSYAHGHYYELGRQLGHFGFSVKKKTGKKRASKAKR